jgi:hypothetical protein
MEKYDFSGWATRNDLLCSDGRTIRKDAFKEQDGAKVPLVWNHGHTELKNVIGHALLKNTPEGVRVYGKFNTKVPDGRLAKDLVDEGDLNALSIFANQLKQKGTDVLHGVIREVSLVMAGANPGAFIDQVIQHGEASEDAGVIYTGETIALYHFEEGDPDPEDEAESETTENDESASMSHADDEGKEESKVADENKKAEGEKTVKEVFDTLNEEQKTVVYAMIGQALEDGEGSDDNEDSEGGNDNMKHNAFDQNDQTQENTLSHDAMNAIIGDAKRFGSMKESFLQHADTYGIDNVEYLFPDEKNVTNTPIFIQRDMGWVQKFMGAVHHTPFSRIKSLFADITEDEARAKGYIKGKLKKEEVFPC